VKTQPPLSRKKRFELFVDYFSAHQPNAQTELNYSTPFELLVAVILSAQCTDKRVNMVTPALFKAFPTENELAQSTPEEVFEYIRSISYPNAKAKHLVGMATKLRDEMHGEIPSEIDALMSLPGVGRKTANVISSVIYNQPSMAVDTHVFRVAARIGLTHNAKTPLQAEEQLVKHIPEKYIALAHHWLILHGRYICVARNPKCNDCAIRHFCKSAPVR
jgi:endonuclease-3